MKNVIKILDRYYQSFMDKKRDWDFFLGLAYYVKYIVETPETDWIIKSVIQKRIDIEKRLKKYEQKVIKETKQAKKKLFKIIKEHKISDEALDRAVKEYQGYEKGIILSPQSKGEALSNALIDIIQILFKRSYKELVKDFAIKHKEMPNEVGKYTFSKTLDLYYEEKEIFNDKIKTELWASWDNLILVYLIVFEGREKLKELRKDEKNFYTVWNFVELADEMRKIRDGDINELTGMPSEFEPIHFIKENYISYASRVHTHLLKELNLKIIKKEIQEDNIFNNKPKEEIIKNTLKEKKLYWISLKNRSILLNDKHLIVKSQFNRPSELYFEYIYKKPREKIQRDEISNQIGKKMKSDFNKFVNNLGFKGELRKCFFDVSKVVIRFINPITKKDLEERLIDIPKLEKQIKKLPEIK